MSKAKGRPKVAATSPAQRAKLTANESLKRMQGFAKRKEDFVATATTKQPTHL